MRKIILIGNIACGKTTLCQRINGMAMDYKKTQAPEVYGQTIDTPGEYLENRALTRNLVVTALEADVVVFVVDATQERYMFSPGQSNSFAQTVIGVVSKIDIATEKQRNTARQLLELAGAQRIFELSSRTGEGVEDFLQYLRQEK